MKKLIALLLALTMVATLAACSSTPSDEPSQSQPVETQPVESQPAESTMGDPVDRSEYSIPETYTKVKIFSGSYGFGDAEIIAAMNDDESAFYIQFVCFDEDQILEGTVANGIAIVSFDLSGFVSGDAQLIYDDALASDELWCPLTGEGSAADHPQSPDTSDTPAPDSGELTGNSVVAQGDAAFTVNRLPAIVSIHTQEQRDYLAMDYTQIMTTTPSTEEKSHPVVLTLSWTLDESGVSAESYTVTLSESESLADAREFSVAGTSLELTNLKIDTQYYWNVTAHADGKDYTSDTYTFQTEADGPRSLCVDSVANVRDLGGWKTTDGGQVRQGLIFRGAKLNADYSTEPIVSQTGVDTLRNELGIRTEIDLRRNEDNESGNLSGSVLGEDVAYYSIPMASTGYISPADNAEEIQTLFQILADENNYPVYFHCSIGTDRTGLVAHLINGLLGVAEEDLAHDFMFSNLGAINGYRKVNRIDIWKKLICSAEGSTYSEQVYNYLLSLGVPEANLQSVISILKEMP